MTQTSPALSRIPAWVWCLASVAAAALSVGSVISQDWVPIDEGTLALSARYASDGLLPHRDFAYPYTGGLAFIGAAAVRAFGDTMLSARLVLLAAMIPWLCCVFAIARRHSESQVAAITVLLCAWWSVLVYRAAMPTWYLLFLATAAVLALIKWRESGRARWLVAAGLACGAAVVIKQTGLFTLIGAGFGILAVQQDRARAAGTRWSNPIVVVLLVLAFGVPVSLIVQRGALSGEALGLALPLAVVLSALIVRERRWGSGSPKALVDSWGLLLAGFGVFPAILALVYFIQGAGGDLAAGLGAGTLRTASLLQFEMFSLQETLRYGLPVLAVVIAVALLKPSRGQLAVSLAVAVAGFTLAYKYDAGYRTVWHLATLAIPAAVFWYGDLERRSTTGGAIPATILIVATALVMHALNQFPFGFANYFAYVAPLAFLLLGAIAAHVGMTKRLVFVAALLAVFGGWFNRIGGVQTAGFGPIWWDAKHALPGPHAAITVVPQDSATYGRLTQLVREHGGADSLVAGPELTALYALSGTTRIVRQPYLIVDNAEADSASLATAFDLVATRAVAIQHEPTFLPKLSAQAQAWLAARYPHAERVGTIEFRWR